MIEFVTGLVMVLLAMKYSPRFFPLYYFSQFDLSMVEPSILFDNFPQALINQAYAECGAFFLFFTALIIACATDLFGMVIPQFVTVWLMPVGVILSYYQVTYVGWQKSMLGVLLGYGGIWIVAKGYQFFTKREGIGLGDAELLGMIGAFLGPVGAWFALMIASFIGAIGGGGYLFLSGKSRLTRMPFGPFIAFGATIYFFLRENLLQFFFR